MFKKLLSIIFIISFVANAQTKTQEEITNFNVEYNVQEDGTVYVIETIDYYFPEPKHGIYREIPLKKVNQDGETYLMTASNIYVYKDERRHVTFEDYSKYDRIKLQIGNPDLLVTGARTYTIHYTLSGALTYFSDHDEFYWNVTGNDWEVPIKSSKVIVRLPNTISKDVTANCFTGNLGSTETNCSATPIANEIFYITNDGLSQGDGLTITAFFPKGHVAVLEPIKDKISNRVLIFAIIFISLFYVLLPTYLIVKAIKKLRKTEEEKRIVAAWFDPPKNINGAPLTASEVGILHDKKGDIRDFTAGIVQLAQKGFIKIEEIPKQGIFSSTDYKLTLKNQPKESISKHEVTILDILFSDKKFNFEKLFSMFGKKDYVEKKHEATDFVDTVEDYEVLISELSKRTSISTELSKFYSNISSDLYEEGMFEEDPIKTKNNWIAATVLAAMFFNPLLLVAFFLMSRSAKRTSKGGEAYAVIESLNNFVKSQDKQLEFQAKNQMMFEKLLPYAIALGVEKIWVERFKDLEFTKSDWYVSSSGYNALAFTNFATNFSPMVTKNVNISSTRSSSGFSSGGGGFSGGGGGGGGGGSW